MIRIPGVTFHAREQMAARHFYEPSRAEWLAGVASILDRTALLMSHMIADGKQRWRVRVGPIECDVLWAADSTGEAQIITVLPSSGGAMNPRRVRERQQRAKGHGVGRPDTRERHRPRYEAEDGA